MIHSLRIHINKTFTNEQRCAEVKVNNGGREGGRKGRFFTFIVQPYKKICSIAQDWTKSWRVRLEFFNRLKRGSCLSEYHITMIYEGVLGDPKLGMLSQKNLQIAVFRAAEKESISCRKLSTIPAVWKDDRSGNTRSFYENKFCPANDTFKQVIEIIVN